MMLLLPLPLPLFISSRRHYLHLQKRHHAIATATPPSPPSPVSFSMELSGVDSDGNTFHSRSHLWSQEAGESYSTGTISDPLKKQQWYSKGISYWQGVEASVDGVLGGFGHVNDADVAASDDFLMEVFKNISGHSLLGSNQLVALDCGAGVGRVTKNLLLRRFHEVDLVEPVSHFLDAAKGDLSDVSQSLGRVVNFYCTSLQDFTPESNRYDVIWVQWCIGHLTDNDLVNFFARAKDGLKTNGFFVVKENIVKTGFIVDKVDNSITRSNAYFGDLFKQAGLYLYESKLQKGFPKELFGVRMYALTTQPIKGSQPAQHTRSKRGLNLPRVIT